MMVAVEKSMSFDEDAEYQRQLEIVNAMGRDLTAMQGVETFTRTPGAEAREPYIEVHWDAEMYKVTPAEVKMALRDGDPSVEIRGLYLSDGQIHLTATMLKEGEAEMVSSSLKEILLASA